MMNRRLALPVIAVLLPFAMLRAVSGAATPVHVVAAERAYGDIAAQIAGPDAVVTALLTNPALDPHEFEPAPSTARAIDGAQITIANGLGYDSWMDRLLGASSAPGAHIVVARLLHRPDGANPHLWYNPDAMPAVARAVASALRAADPAHAESYAGRERSVLASLAALRVRIDGLRLKIGGLRVAGTEPVFAPMEAALGLDDRAARFELSQMNGTEPRASDVAAVQDDLRAHRVRVLFTNAQTAGPASAQLVTIARASGVPVVAVAETLPRGTTYQAWIGATLDEVERAFGPAS